VNLSSPDDLPASLADHWRQVALRLAELPEDTLQRPSAAADTLARVCVCSDFVLSTLLRQSEALLERLVDEAPLSAETLSSRFDLTGLGEEQAMAVLRRVRNVEMARIAWRDLAGWTDLDTNLRDLSVLADCAIRAATAFAVEQLEPRYGRPRDSEGDPASLLILGMGKLGGCELNYSSDIDLVLLYPEDVSPDGRAESDSEGYFRRLAQLLIKLLDQNTPDGFVFRVDTRLRPFGASGPLVVSVPSLESYLVRHGRDWERYAYVKARLITGERYEAEIFDEILTPFVYRRYLDYGVFDALRQMKALITREVARRDMAENIKLGPGGIREIEFIVQAIQLVRGGQNPILRDRSLLSVLPKLGESRYLENDAVVGLADAYRFLRTLENRMQAVDDQQVHDLPSASNSRERLAYSMKTAGWDELYEQLARHRRFVQAQFARVALVDSAVPAEAAGLQSWAAAWEEGELGEVLAATGINEAAEVASQLEALRGGPLYTRMDETSRQRLSRVMSRMIPMLIGDARPAYTLRRVLPVLEAVGRRSAYLALLNENPAALQRLLTLASQSEFLVRQVTEHPLLLDELLDARVLEIPPSRAELEAALEQTLGRDPTHDVESRLEVMRRFQRAAVFHIAVADRLGHLPLMEVSDRLTDTAELILQLALETAWAELVAKYGKPQCGDEPRLRDAEFAIIGYGKLGGLELGYGSDLDLVFLHDSAGRHQETNGDSPVDNERFFVRLVQRIIHFLSIQTSSGRLYEVDTRLRPSGRSGYIVARMDTFKQYQRKQAWVWEHQALLRSRDVAGAADLREAFEEERRNVLIRYVKRDSLKQEVAGMRERMRAELSGSDAEEFDIKQDRGGLADIEFLIDYWILAHAQDFPQLVEFPDKVRQLEALASVGLVSSDRCARLKSVYLGLRRRLHELALDEGGRIIAADEFASDRDWVRLLWGEVFAA